MSDGHLLVAYHGCDITTRDDLVAGRLKTLDQSKNRYDWLGPGTYFFEGDPVRALLFATASRDNPGKMYTKRPIASPAVVGAVLCVQRWLDMTSQSGIREFMQAAEPTIKGFHEDGTRIPTNAVAGPDDQDVILRALDNAIISFIHGARKKDGKPDFQAVRGAFPQGQPLVDNSGFREHSHIQIAVRDPSCVLGWFLPPEVPIPLLTPEQYGLAKKKLEAAVRNRKPRVRGGQPA
ncbi:hypothetical protein GO286_04229 [Ralstonia solanacearum]|nr:hypothetical protein [Ralstonia solanacearum]